MCALYLGSIYMYGLAMLFTYNIMNVFWDLLGFLATKETCLLTSSSMGELRVIHSKNESRNTCMY